MFTYHTSRGVLDSWSSARDAFYMVISCRNIREHGHIYTFMPKMMVQIWVQLKHAPDEFFAPFGYVFLHPISFFTPLLVPFKPFHASLLLTKQCGKREQLKPGLGNR